jgi:hypothetical protein
MTAANSLNISEVGFQSFDGINLFKGRTLTAGTGVTITNGNGVSGNPTISASGAIGQTITGNSGGALSPSSGNWNILGTGSLTTVGSGSTLTAQLTGLTNHSVLIGAGTATITKVGPTATSGQVLQSAGSSADPAFSTATYPATTTINQVLYSSAANTVSEITAANNGTMISSATGVPSWLANGTTGQVLTATTGSPPSWGAIPSSFLPNSVVTLKDDFITSSSGQNNIGELPWFSANGTSTWQPSASSFTTNPGIIQNNAASGVMFLFGSSNNAFSIIPTLKLGGGAISVNWVIKTAILSAASPRYQLYIGLGDTSTAADQANGVYFKYSDNLNSGNWIGNTASASSRSTANSAIAAQTSTFVNLGITIDAGATSVGFFINGVQIANSPLAANIPTAAITPFINLIPTVGTTAAGSLLVDLFYMTQTLTTPR